MAFPESNLSKVLFIIVPFSLFFLDIRNDNVHDMECERSYSRKENDNEHEKTEHRPAWSVS